MAYQAHWLETGATFEVQPGEAVLSAALRQDVRLPHECRFGGCGTCKVKLTKGSVGYEEQPMGLSEEDAAEGYALLCQAHACADIAFSTPTQPVIEPVLVEATVQGVQEIGPDVLHLRLALPQGQSIPFLPGQYMNIKLPEGHCRSFSMASKPTSQGIDFHVRRIPGGQFTDKTLPSMRPGECLTIEIPHGSFYYRESDYRPLLMLATGTGMAPIKSILESLMDSPDCPPVSLYWGARTLEDLYIHNEIAEWSDRLYEFNYVPVLSRAASGWKGRVGYVQDAVVEDNIELAEYALYICGSVEMVSDAKRELIARGADPQYIYTDSFVFNTKDRV